jgi:hypothetical protein
MQLIRISVRGECTVCWILARDPEYGAWIAGTKATVENGVRTCYAEGEPRQVCALLQPKQLVGTASRC